MEQRRVVLAWSYFQCSLACGGETCSPSGSRRVLRLSVKVLRNCLHKLLSFLVGFSLGNVTFLANRPDASRRSSDKVLPSQWTRSERCMRLRYFRTTLILSRVLCLHPFSIATSIIDRCPCQTGLLWYLSSTSSSTTNLWHSSHRL